MSMRLILLTFCLNCFFYSNSYADFDEDRYLANIEQAFLFPRTHWGADSQVFKDLFLQIYREEKANPDYVQCLTSQDSVFYAYQVVAKELYRQLHGEAKEDFEFLRFPDQSLSKDRKDFFARYPTMFLSKEELAKVFRTTLDNLEFTFEAREIQTEGIYMTIASGGKEERIDDDDDDDSDDNSSRYLINDTLPEVSKELIAVSFTMESFLPMDSALHVFLANNSVSLSNYDDGNISDKVTEVFRGIFRYLSAPEGEVTRCIEELIARAPRSEYGIINQVFLPRDNIANTLYLSHSGGFYHSIFDPEFDRYFDEFQNTRQKDTFRTFRNFQGRIIAGSLVHDPRIKIKRYTLIPESEQHEYESFVRHTLREFLIRNGLVL